MESAPPAAPALPRTSPQAVWSLVLGILSITCLWLLGSIPAIILGILAIRNIDASSGALEGRGKAIAGIITGGVGIIAGLAFVGIVVATFIPAFSKVRENANAIYQVNEIRQITMACKMYAMENDGKFPPHLEVLVPNFLESEELLTWEDRKTREKLPYLYRPGLKQESAPDEPIVLAPAAINHRRAVGYADGHVEAMKLPLPEELLEKFPQAKSPF